MTTPALGVKYRIQSVDLLTYLELLNPTSSSTTTIKLRSFKETDSQYWIFELVPGYSSYYYVKNVGNPNRYLYYSSGSLAAGSQSSYAYVTPSYSNNAYQLRIYSNSYYLTTDESSSVSCSSSSSTYNPDSQRWQLVPVTAQPINSHQLTTGPYRIRNHNGESLLTMPKKDSTGGTNIYVESQFEQDDQSPYQRWAVTLQPSGNYTIQNAGTNTYLGCSSASAVVGDGLVGLTTAFQWDLQSVGFAWSLRIPAAELSVGVADYEIEDKDEVSLVPSDVTPTQIWFMEKYFPLVHEKIHAKREIDEGKYILQSVHDQSIYMNVLSTPWRITPGTVATHKFELKYIKDTAHFKLTYVPSTTSTDPSPLVADLGGYLGLTSTGTEFVLLEKYKDDPGYFICRPELGRPHKIVSNRTTTDINKNTVFAIDNMTQGSAVQMWKLVPKS